MGGFSERALTPVRIENSTSVSQCNVVTYVGFQSSEDERLHDLLGLVNLLPVKCTGLIHLLKVIKVISEHYPNIAKHYCILPPHNV